MPQVQGKPGSQTAGPLPNTGSMSMGAMGMGLPPRVGSGPMPGGFTHGAFGPGTGSMGGWGGVGQGQGFGQGGGGFGGFGQMPGGFGQGFGGFGQNGYGMLGQGFAHPQGGAPQPITQADGQGAVAGPQGLLSAVLPPQHPVVAPTGVMGINPTGVMPLNPASKPNTVKRQLGAMQFGGVGY